MRKKTKLIYGVGVNDSEDPISIKTGNTTYKCPYYIRWYRMIRRGYSDAKKKRKPTYKDVTVCKEWHSFSNFKAWCIEVGYGEHNRELELDKDLLVPYSKVYSPQTCTFVSQGLNKFLSHATARRGAYPIGVTWSKTREKFQSNCRNPFTGVGEHLGYYTTAEAAHKAWLKRKDHFAQRLAEEADILEDRLRDALRTRYKNYHL